MIVKLKAQESRPWEERLDRNENTATEGPIAVVVKSLARYFDFLFSVSSPLCVATENFYMITTIIYANVNGIGK